MVNFEWSPFLVQPGHLYTYTVGSVGEMLKGGRGWRGVAGREGGGWRIQQSAQLHRLHPLL